MSSLHITIAHQYWQKFLQKDHIAIDATCGNGHDALFLCRLVKKLFVYDIQKIALDKTKERLARQNSCPVSFIHASHAAFLQAEADLVVYNLGYLPGGDKQITTKTESTLLSLQSALGILRPCGALSVTCYPGHKEGLLEETAINDFFSRLNSNEYSVCRHQWINRALAPSLFWVRKKL